MTIAVAKVTCMLWSVVVVAVEGVGTARPILAGTVATWCAAWPVCGPSSSYLHLIRVSYSPHTELLSEILEEHDSCEQNGKKMKHRDRATVVLQRLPSKQLSA